MPSYNDFSNALREMHTMEVLKLKSSLESLNNHHACLVNDQLCMSHTLEEKLERLSLRLILV